MGELVTPAALIENQAIGAAALALVRATLSHHAADLRQLEASGFVISVTVKGREMGVSLQPIKPNAFFPLGHNGDGLIRGPG